MRRPHGNRTGAYHHTGTPDDGTTVSAEITARSHDPSSSKWKRRAALERWAEFVGACADGRPADIIPIRPPLTAVA